MQGAKTVLRGAPSGEKGLAGSDRLGLPKPTPGTAGASRVSRMKVPGARRGRTALCGRSCLRKPPGPAGGLGLGDCPQRWVHYCYKHCIHLKSNSLGPCLEGRHRGRPEGVWCGQGCSSVPQGQCLSSCLWALSCWWTPFAEPELLTAWDLSGQLLMASMSLSTC